MIREPQPIQRPIPPAVQKAYGAADLGANPIFAGGFINFGHWQAIDLDSGLSHEDRVRSQQDMYRHVLDALPSTGQLRALEVGPGTGVGTALALEEYGFAHVTGMDIHPRQVERAREANSRVLADRPEHLGFVQGAAEDMPFGDEEFDCLYSVEAAQHFSDLTAFGQETARVLRPGGHAVIASFFTTDDTPGHAEHLAAHLDCYANGLDLAHPVTHVTEALNRAGLAQTRAVSIGPDVWQGWDRWVAHVSGPDAWPRNFLRAYEEGVLDYYVITATRPAAARAH
ncbi:class I SAM-dependent methyltransferase [Streptomyces hesseae]|uniref:Class I SAM-dependent methyltransferase n=1 Tax=Streptomyces hesseae TaxID=3075519 RepID=A0ABU2SL15_9ACTN|nr:class I SAM-dependent methyltransferase [Streptomyces sp. DSM 40473]MDT0449493.1 class I SAM-dependent methyltransferase [Streptomyces sp. DSM 40473]